MAIKRAKLAIWLETRNQVGKNTKRYHPSVPSLAASFTASSRLVPSAATGIEGPRRDHVGSTQVVCSCQPCIADECLAKGGVFY
jgi:hypothetical protein